MNMETNLLNDIKSMRQDAIQIYRAGLHAVAPDRAILRHCHIDGRYLIAGGCPYDLDHYAHIFIIGAGKASAAMAVAVEKLLGSRISKGTIIVKYDHSLKLNRITVDQSGHPIPDANGVRAAGRVLELARQARAEDLVICLISGGGSALMPLPATGISLSDKQTTTELLLRCGAKIQAINTIRKHLSGIKGGQLARAAAPATLLTLILSDVVGDDLEVIASGPTVPDPTSFEECLKIISEFGLSNTIPSNVINHLKKGMISAQLETPKPGDPCFQNVQNLIVANNREAVLAAKVKADTLGYNTLILSSMIEGETNQVACVHAAMAKEIIQSGNPLPPPACLISGGEPTVTIQGTGKGGRNQEFALAAASKLGLQGKITVLAAGTDGTDGPTDATGAFSDITTVARATAKGMNPAVFLKNNDAYNFFKNLDDLFITGPTQTNVMDLQIVLVR